MIERIVIKRGLDLPLEGLPQQSIESAAEVSRVALVADDYLGLRPTMLVSEGDKVRTGQIVMEDKKTVGVKFASPATGKVVAVHRGEKRRFLAMEIEVEGKDDPIRFEKSSQSAADLDRAKVISHLVQSGLWTALRTRPYGRVPSPESTPYAIFVTAIDTNPLAADPKLVIDEYRESFVLGVLALSKLTDGTLFICRGPGSNVPGEAMERVRVVEFEGPHPAGLPGTHMHFLAPAHSKRINWHIGYQDVIAIGKLFALGVLDPTRVISLAGPMVKKPRLVRTRLGAKISELVRNELVDGKKRIISGSVLCGRKVTEPFDYLTRYSNQVSVIAEGDQREFLGWQQPGFNKFSVTRAFASALSFGKRFALTTSTEGSERAMVPIGTYEKVMPLDLVPTLLLRALITRDTERAQELGCLELEEEDLALCTFVCPGKYEYGEILRDNLLKIEKEG